MTKQAKIFISIFVGMLFAAFAYSQNLNAQNQILTDEVMQLKEKVASLERRVGAIEETTKPRVVPAK